MLKNGASLLAPGLRRKTRVAHSRASSENLTAKTLLHDNMRYCVAEESEL